MLEELGIDFLSPSWHFWVAVGINLIINMMLNMNPQIYLRYRWLYLALPLVFSVLIYFVLGIILAYAGVV